MTLVLTDNELRVLQGTAAGEQAKETAARLALSFHTVKTYRRRLLVKLGARTAAQAVAVAYRRGLLGEPRAESSEPSKANERQLGAFHARSSRRDRELHLERGATKKEGLARFGHESASELSYAEASSLLDWLEPYAA